MRATTSSVRLRAGRSGRSRASLSAPREAARLDGRRVIVQVLKPMRSVFNSFAQGAIALVRNPAATEETLQSRRRRRRKPMDRRSVVKLGLAGLAIGAVRVPAAFGQAKIVLKATDVHPLGYPTVEAVERMGKKLEAASNGRISIQMYPSMQLGGEKEMIEQAQVGALQIARISVGAMGPGVDA